MTSKISIYAFTIFFIFGCTGHSSLNSSIRIVNQSLENQFSPMRLVIQKTGGGFVTKGEWAGRPGLSLVELAEPILRSDLTRFIKEKCGFVESQLLERRIVRHENPIFYEVWIYDDPESERDDKKSGITVVMKQLPKGGGIDVVFPGDCHGKEMPISIATSPN